MPGLILCREEKEDDRRQDIGQRISSSSSSSNIPSFLEPLSYKEMDSGGPVFNKQSMLTLRHLFQNNIHHHDDHTKSKKKSPSIYNLQPTHLHSLALSNNLAAPMFLPSNIAPYFLQTCLPSAYLQNKLTTLASDIIMDDAALIEEGQLDSECSGMTEEEVLDACWLRGLPLASFVRNNKSGDHGDYGKEDEVHTMRQVLKHHLQMMEAVMMDPLICNSTTSKTVLRSKGILVRDTTLQLLILHLPAIRCSMKRGIELPDRHGA